MVADPSYVPKDGRSVIYFAGGCFWGVEKAFSVMRGVTDTECGYANGFDRLIPDYMLVCSGKYGYLEAVRVEYDPKIIGSDLLLTAFFMIIDPTDRDRQGNDIGHQYNTGIYWTDESTGRSVKAFTEQERKKYKVFYTEIGPLERFTVAEPEHQDYLDRNPGGYCHVPERTIRVLRMF
jgi:peptide methionine sulfoxide reductase msrA/msrB